jgi:4-amino-4-deoxy-L-arabinose transferase-like glycosyltransferase
MTLTKLLKHPYAPLVIVVTAAVALRLAYILFFGNTLSLGTSGYDTYATNLLAGHGYTRFADLHPDSDLPPLYSFFLVGVYVTLGHTAIAVALVQIILDAITIVAIFAIGRRVGGNIVGFLAAAFTGFYPYLLFQNLTVNDTALFITLLTVAIWAIYRANDLKSWRWAACAGILLGLAALTKTLVILLLPLIALWWWRTMGLRIAVQLAFVLSIAFILFPLPWMVRNIQLQHAFVFISTNDGSNLYQGNNPLVADLLLQGYDVQWTGLHLPNPPKGLSEVDESAWFRNYALDYLRNNPGEWPRLFTAKFISLWNPELRPRAAPPDAQQTGLDVYQYETPIFQLARVLHVIYFTPLLILGVIGFWLCWRDKRPILPIISILISITIAYLIYHPSTRYRSPADPFLFVLSAYSVEWIRQQISLRRHSTQVVLAGHETH